MCQFETVESLSIPPTISHSIQFKRLLVTTYSPNSEFWTDPSYACVHTRRLIITEAESDRSLFFTFEGWAWSFSFTMYVSAWICW